HVEHGQLVQRAPVHRLRELAQRQLAARAQKPHPAHPGLDTQERVVHVEERCCGHGYLIVTSSSTFTTMFEPPCTSVPAKIDPMRAPSNADSRSGKSVVTRRTRTRLVMWPRQNASEHSTSASPTLPPHSVRFGGNRFSRSPSNRPRKNSSSGSATTTYCTRQ